MSVHCPPFSPARTLGFSEEAVHWTYQIKSHVELFGAMPLFFFFQLTRSRCTPPIHPAISDYDDSDGGRD